MIYNRASSPQIAGATGGVIFFLIFESLPNFILKGVCDMAKIDLELLLEKKNEKYTC